MSDRDKRALRWLAGAVVLFLLLQLDVFAPSTGGGSTPGSSSSIAALEEELKVAQARARQKPISDAELAAAQRRLDVREQRLLTSPDAALAQAEMQQIVGELLVAEGIVMKGSRFVSAALEGEDYARIAVAVNFSCGIEQLVNLMASISNAERLLTPRDLRVRPDNKGIKSVRVELTVAGYLPLDRAPELAPKQRTQSIAQGGLL